MRIKNLEEQVGVKLLRRNFHKRAAADLQRTLRWRIQVSSFKTACRMIEANVGVLPEGTARRLQICVADLDALPRFARTLVDLLVEDGLGRQDRADSRPLTRECAGRAPIRSRQHVNGVDSFCLRRPCRH